MSDTDQRAAYLRGFKAAVFGVQNKTAVPEEVRFAWQAGNGAGIRALKQAESMANEFVRRLRNKEQQSPTGGG